MHQLVHVCVVPSFRARAGAALSERLRARPVGRPSGSKQRDKRMIVNARILCLLHMPPTDQAVWVADPCCCWRSSPPRRSGKTSSTSDLTQNTPPHHTWPHITRAHPFPPPRQTRRPPVSGIVRSGRSAAPARSHAGAPANSADTHARHGEREGRRRYVWSMPITTHGQSILDPPTPYPHTDL